VWGSPFKISGHLFSFSFSAKAADGRVEVSIRNPGDFTSEIHKVQARKRVYVHGPYSVFTIGIPADIHLLIAGDMGRYADGEHDPHARRSQRRAARDPAVR